MLVTMPLAPHKVFLLCFQFISAYNGNCQHGRGKIIGGRGLDVDVDVNVAVDGT